MKRNHNAGCMIAFSLVLLFLSSCSSIQTLPPSDQLLNYNSKGEGLTYRQVPTFIVEYPQYEYNRIGTPKVYTHKALGPRVAIDPEQATIFTEERRWQGSKGEYTNLIYRIHFSKIPNSIIPFHIGAGENIGLLVIITLNENEQPLLITTLHTCGCYLAIVPTSYLLPESLPENWNYGQQDIYGELLPGILMYQDTTPDERVSILLRDGTHRVKGLWLEQSQSKGTNLQQTSYLKPLTALSTLYSTSTETVSFFEIEGPRKDYVIGSQKFWERLLISWWALDWRVGEDKRLGRDKNDGPVFYTSLKPWAREESDLRDFAGFLNYWGWRL